MEAKGRQYKVRFEGRIGELVSTDTSDLWKCFKVGRRNGGEIKGIHRGRTRK